MIEEPIVPALIVLLDGKPIAAGPALGTRALGLSPAESRAGIARLLRNGLLVEDGARYRAPAAHVVRGDPKQASARQRRYLAAQLAESHRQFARNYERGAKFAAHTFTVGSERAAEIERRLAAFLETLIAEHDAPENERVMQVNVQVFTPAR